MNTVAVAVAQSKTSQEAALVVREAQRPKQRRWKQELLQEAREHFVAQHLGHR